MEALHQHIRSIVDFPKPGIVFRDITPLLADPHAMRRAVHDLCHPFVGERIDMVAGMEARGFIFGSLVAQALGVGFVPLRKPGKLPHTTEQVHYDLEYGSATLEAHIDALSHDQHVLLIDDLIATGGTARASCDLIEKLGGHIAGCAFVIELTELGGRDLLAPHRVHSILRY